MALKNHSLAPTKEFNLNDRLDNLNDTQLLSLRHEIDLRLKIDINKLDLAEELGLQYRAGTTLLASVQNDSGVPANQRSQVFNSVSSLLDKILKQMKIAFSAERLKRYEVALLKVLESLPDESKRLFFDLYGEYLKDDEAAEEARKKELEDA